MKTIEGEINITGKKYAIILSRFNEFIGAQLLEGAIDCFRKHGVSENDITLVKVPGAFEIPLTAAKLAESGQYTSIICLGAIVKGDTPHFEYISGSTAAGIQQVSLKYGIPVIFGVLTTNNVEQAIERASTSKMNKGWDAAITAIEMGNILDKLK
jgi:6,7-dimethyl-8-ribityllumazine synthase